MAIWIHQNQYAARVLADLRTICDDPGLTVDPAGKISYNQTMSGIGASTLAVLQKFPVVLQTPSAPLHATATISIRGESPNWGVGAPKPTPGQPPKAAKILSEVAGVTMPDTYPGTRSVDIVYDPTGCSNGLGYVTFDKQGVLTELTSDQILFHEICHAIHCFSGAYGPNGPVPESLAIHDENLYREARGQTLRGSHEGGCRGFTPSPPPPAPPPQPKPDTPIGVQAISAVCAPLLLFVPQAIGTDHTFAISELVPGERTYKIYINNETTDTFTEIVVFYKRVGLPGVVFLRNENVQPRQVSTFVCGLCKDLENYVVGFFIGNEQVFKFPASGNMTPALASQVKPTDQDPCVDFWTIG